MISFMVSRRDIDTVRRSFVVSTLASACANPARVQAQATTLQIGRTDYPSPISEIEERVLIEAFGRIGVRCQFVRLPLLRLIEMANDGSIDGDIGRIPEIAARYPNLIMVPTPICKVDVAAYGGAPDFEHRTRTQIAGMNIGIVRGVFVLSKYSKGMKFVEVQNFEAIINMLANGRIDAALTVHLDTEILRQNQQIPAMVRWPYLWAWEPLHFLLHKKHSALVPRLDEVLRGMTKAGLIERYYMDALKKINVLPLRPATAAPQ